MTNKKNSRNTIEYGDFQTPHWFAEQLCDLVVALGCRPTTIVEPTCGIGSLLLASLRKFPAIHHAYGIEINPQYAAVATQSLVAAQLDGRATVINEDFFNVNWEQFISTEQTTLFIGNPPWVTNTQLATLHSDNRPKKTNVNGLSGIEAMTGSSNFDISESMLLQLLQFYATKRIVLAMLCKTTVARKLLAHLWHRAETSIEAKLFRLDSDNVFGVNVDACLLYVDATNCRDDHSNKCDVYSSLSVDSYANTFGYQDNCLVANFVYYHRWKHLTATEICPNYRWRSGIKHDCSDVMEFNRFGHLYTNRIGENPELDERYLFPLLKSSDVAKWPNIGVGSRWMLVTQKHVGEETNSINSFAPKTWNYLVAHANRLDVRKSSIYKEKPRFSIFGVGPYTFSEWKIAISGLYKQLTFALVGPYGGKPVVFDDTCYILPCRSEGEAKLLFSLLDSQIAREFYEAHIFWDAKRPITTKLLNQLDLNKVAQELNSADEYAQFQSQERTKDRASLTQLQLFE